MRKITALLLTTVFVGMIGPQCAYAKDESLHIYVDKNAEVSGDGSFERPFLSIREAKDEIRRIKSDSGYPEGGITVSIRQGDYSLTDGIAFTAEDSGTKDAPVVYRAYANEEVRLLGGNEIEFSKFKKTEDNAVLQRLDPAAAQKVYELDLKENGIEEYGPFGIVGQAASGMNSKGQNPTNSASLPVIYWNNEMTSIARYPNNSYMKVDKVLSNGSTDNYSEQMSFTVADSRVSNWENADDLWLWGMLRYDWADIHLPVASVEKDSATINTKYSCDYGVLSGQKFYVYNVFEELDAPGEWYYDKKSGKLYMIPLDNDTNAKLMLSFSSNSILSFDRAEYITFRDMSILGSRAGAIGANMSRGISVKYCEIAYCSGNGFTVNGDPGGRTFGDSSYECSVEGCHIHDVGGCGIYFHYVGNRGDLTPSGCRAFNNWIHNFGNITRTYSGAVNTRGAGIDIAFNLIHDGPHLALNPGSNDTTVRYNEISNVLKETSDSGVIYFGGDTAVRGVQIDSNKIHDCTTSSAQHQIHAIYNDDAGAGAEIRNNIIYNVSGNGVFINGGRDNTVENNIFANLSGVGVVLKASFLSGDWYTNWETGKLGNAVFKNVIDYKSEPYLKYPHLSTIAEDDPPYPKYNVMQNNVTYNSKGGQTIDPLSSGYSVKQIAAWGTVGDEIVTNRDIGFKDAKNNNYALKDDSQVFEKLGDFKQIESERIGLVTSRLRAALSRDSMAMVVGEPRTYVNWTRKMIDENNLDTTPFIKDNLAYIPIRFLFEGFGAEVSWQNDHAEILYDGKKIVMTQGEKTATVDGEAYDINGDILNIGGRIFIPLRSASSLIGKNVIWKDGLIIISGQNIEKLFDYEETVYDLKQRLSER